MAAIKAEQLGGWWCSYVLMVTKCLNWTKFDAASSGPMNRYCYEPKVHFQLLSSIWSIYKLKIRLQKEVYPFVFPSSPNILSRIMASRVPVTQKIAWWVHKSCSAATDAEMQPKQCTTSECHPMWSWQNPWWFSSCSSPSWTLFACSLPSLVHKASRFSEIKSRTLLVAKTREHTAYEYDFQEVILTFRKFLWISGYCISSTYRYLGSMVVGCSYVTMLFCTLHHLLEGPVVVAHVLCAPFSFDALPMDRLMPAGRKRPAFDENNIP